MTNGARRHHFEVGEQYRNEDGVYTVLRIEGPDMVIQYEDGRTLQSSIKLQARIWERIQTENAIAAEDAASKTAARRRGGSRSRASLGRDFHGLQDTDFRRGLSGTTWRRRSELAGLLAARLSDLSGQIFESRAVPRRPQAYIVQPQHYSPDRSLCAAKFLFGLSETGASYGFYIEKSDEPMDDTWDWARFLAAVAEDKSLQARTLVAMEHCNLRWEINVEMPDGPADRYVTTQQETLYLQTQADGEPTPLEWAGFGELLAAVPADGWCNVYLMAYTDKASALELGVGLAQEVANVYNALLPLYAASVQR